MTDLPPDAAKALPVYSVTDSGCWILRQKPNSTTGYVYLGAKHVNAPRLFYETIVGPIQGRLVLDHIWPRCKNRACVRPKWSGDPQGHTEPVTHRENTRRGTSIVARKMDAAVCERGHPYSPENTSTARNGDGKLARRCVTCRQATDHAWGIKKRSTPEGREKDNLKRKARYYRAKYGSS